MESCRCVLIGADSLLNNLAAELIQLGADAELYKSAAEWEGARASFTRADCLFISAGLGDGLIRKLAEKGKLQNQHLRIVLIDPNKKLAELSREIGAHSIVGVKADQAETIARFWAITIYPR